MTAIGPAGIALIIFALGIASLAAASSFEQVIRGASHLKFDGEGRIRYHRDYWDAAEELYEKLPVLGGLMRLLKKRAAS